MAHRAPRSSAGSSPASTGTLKSGGSLRVGATGGGAKDTIDAHLPTADPDIMRCWNLYEPLAVRPPSFGPLEMMVAESIEAEHGKADSWIVKIRPGIEFHNGKTVTPEDVDLLAATGSWTRRTRRSARRRSATSTSRAIKKVGPRTRCGSR